MPAGRPAWEPTDAERRVVEHYVSIGFTHEQIGLIMEKSVDSLTRHCRRELDAGKLKAHAQIGGKLYSEAMKGNTALLIFYAKTQMGWKETVRNEHSGLDGAPIAVRDVSALTDAQLEALSLLGYDESK